MRGRPLLLLVCTIVLALTSCEQEHHGPTEDCSTLLDEDRDGARACDDPDCLEADECQIRWSSQWEIALGTALVPEYGVEGGAVSGRVTTGLSNGWMDMNGDGTPDGLAVLTCSAGGGPPDYG